MKVPVFDNIFETNRIGACFQYKQGSQFSQKMHTFNENTTVNKTKSKLVAGFG